MDANADRTQAGYRRIGRLLLAIGSFLGAFIIISHVAILLGVDSADANAAGLICGLAIVAYAMHHRWGH